MENLEIKKTLLNICQKNDEERRKNFNYQLNNSSLKETTPFFSISSFDFCNETRSCHIEFLETKKYKKIERYVTSNYVKYPIYSDWNTKTKNVRKVLRLSNQELENLISNNDLLIQNFSFEIINKLDNIDLIPSWCMKKIVLEYRTEKIMKNNNDFEIYLSKVMFQKNICEDSIARLTNENEKINKKLNRFTKRRNKKYSLLQKILLRQDNLFLSLISFGIYSFLKSNYRINKFHQKLSKLDNNILNFKKEIERKETEIEKYQMNIQEIDKDIAKNKIQTQKNNAKVNADCENDLASICVLPASLQSNSDIFIPLKKLIGMQYERITGCYVIHNKEFDKYYVGQSKDVMKRLRQHFNGTLVKNIIFAEDYFKSQYEDKSNIFEIMIIRLSTKDELDYTEKKLIEKYDAFTHGYNGTNGNS